MRQFIQQTDSVIEILEDLKGAFAGKPFLDAFDEPHEWDVYSVFESMQEAQEKLAALGASFAIENTKKLAKGESDHLPVVMK